MRMLDSRLAAVFDGYVASSSNSSSSGSISGSSSSSSI